MVNIEGLSQENKYNASDLYYTALNRKSHKFPLSNSTNGVIGRLWCLPDPTLG
jgi:hypothetical protein